MLRRRNQRMPRRHAREAAKKARKQFKQQLDETMNEDQVNTIPDNEDEPQEEQELDPMIVDEVITIPDDEDEPQEEQELESMIVDEVITIPDTPDIPPTNLEPTEDDIPPTNLEPTEDEPQIEQELEFPDDEERRVPDISETNLPDVDKVVDMTGSNQSSADATSSNQKTCVICMDTSKEVNHACIPCNLNPFNPNKCGHLAFCQSCANEYKNMCGPAGLACPICRQKPILIYQIY